MHSDRYKEYRKLIPIGAGIILLVLLSGLFHSSSQTDFQWRSKSKLTLRDTLLIITDYNNGEYNDVVTKLLELRNNSISARSYIVDIESELLVQEASQNATLLDSVGELWIVFKEASESTRVATESIITNLTSKHVPIVVATPDISEFSQSILSLFGVLSCGDKEDTQGNITFTYSSKISSILNMSFVSSETFNAKIRYSSCITLTDILVIANLSKIGNGTLSIPAPIMFRPLQNNRMVVLALSFGEQVNSTIETIHRIGMKREFHETSLLSFRSRSNMQISLPDLYLFNALAIITDRAYSSFVIEIENEGLTSNGGDDFLFGGLQIRLPGGIEQIFPIAIVLGLVGAAVYLIRKFWIVFLGVL
ncbi:MAG TPA: hypothetical protein VJ044_08055, partial [Candidatus Hodarchaeales archaeon]|nr:hypothetical protein [Candidatus Hodarchaeales archaeon]